MLGFRQWWAVGRPCGHSGTQALSKLISSRVPVITLLPLSSTFTLHEYVFCDIEQNSFKHLSFLECKMQSFLSRGCWMDMAGGRSCVVSDGCLVGQ